MTWHPTDFLSSGSPDQSESEHTSSQAQHKPATLLSHEEVRPQSFRRKSSRVQQYRRKLRKQRKRRIAVFVVTTATALTLGLAYKMQHPEFTFQRLVPEPFEEDIDVSILDDLLDTAANKTQGMIDKVRSTLTGFTTGEEAKEEPKKKRAVQHCDKLLFLLAN